MAFEGVVSSNLARFSLHQIIDIVYDKVGVTAR